MGWIYKFAFINLFKKRIKIAESGRLVSRLDELVSTKQNTWLYVVATRDASFTYDQFKTFELFKWMHDVEMERANLVKMLTPFLKKNLVTFNLEAKSM